MKWNNVIHLKTKTNNIEKNCINVVEYLDGRYGENFIKEQSIIGIENGESVFLVRTFKKIGEKDLLIFKDILGTDYVSVTSEAKTFHFD